MAISVQWHLLTFAPAGFNISLFKNTFYEFLFSSFFIFFPFKMPFVYFTFMKSFLYSWCLFMFYKDQPKGYSYQSRSIIPAIYSLMFQLLFSDNQSPPPKVVQTFLATLDQWIHFTSWSSLQWFHKYMQYMKQKFKETTLALIIHSDILVILLN